MADTSIEWTDKVWNPVRGCIKVSPGCKNCYAETFAERFRGVKGHPYEQGFDLRLVLEKLNEPLRWKKPRRVFVNSMSDLFQDGVPDEYIGRCFDVMAQARRHTFQVLTKRPGRMRALVPTFAARHTAIDGSGWPLPNVWLGVSVENQHFADERIPLLLQTPAAVRFISAEPLLGPIDLERGGFALHRPTRSPRGKYWPGLDWVIVGGESGPGARRFDLEWGRSLVEQCRECGVPCFIKQLGSRPDGWWTNALGPRLNSHGLTDKKGGDPNEWPEDLRVREFPANGGHA